MNVHEKAEKKAQQNKARIKRCRIHSFDCPGAIEREKARQEKAGVSIPIPPMAVRCRCKNCGGTMYLLYAAPYMEAVGHMKNKQEETMTKKRKCKYTAEEQAIHEAAVRLRKMTDRQLVEAFRRAAEPEVSLSLSDVGQDGPDEIEANKNTSDIQKLLSALSEGRCKGIKGATAYKIAQFAAEMELT